MVCPGCGPYRKPHHRKERKLKVWRFEPDFLSFNCAHCLAQGFARRDGQDAVKIDLEQICRHRAEVERRDADDKQKRTRHALEIWREAEPIAGTLAARYLINRGVDLCVLPDEMERVLRWHSCCPWEHGVAPCLVALWTDTITAEPKAIHRTRLTPKAEKIPPPKSLGPNAGCVIRLWPDDAVTQGLVIGEGIETTLSAASRCEHEGTSLTPAWACGDKGHMAGFPVLAGVESLTLLVDNDVGGEGQRAAEICAQRWCDADREVIRLTPRTPGADFNDLVREAGR